MAINIGSRSIAKIIVEKTEVAKVYVGNMLVYNRTVDPTLPLPLPLTFVAEQANSTVALNRQGSPAWEGEYSLDNKNWLPYVPNTTGNITLVNVGDKVYFRGNISDNFGVSNYLKFVMSGRLGAEGNINSMYVAVGFEELETLTYAFCYRDMFNGCTALTTPPDLPATTLSDYCYYGMFKGCSALTTAPTLPATTLASNCYNSMFQLCSAMTAAPELPATTLTTNCYNNMFRSCTLIRVSLTKEGIYQNTWQFGATLSTYAANMFANTGGTFAGTPTVDVVYTSNTLV